MDQFEHEEKCDAFTFFDNFWKQEHCLSHLMLCEVFYGEDKLTQGYQINLSPVEWTPPAIREDYYTDTVELEERIDEAVKRWWTPSSKTIYTVIAELGNAIQIFVQSLKDYRPKLLQKTDDLAMFSSRLDEQFRDSILNVNEKLNLRKLESGQSEQMYTADMLTNLVRDCEQKIREKANDLRPSTIDEIISKEASNSRRSAHKKFISQAKRILKSLHDTWLESCQGHTYPVQRQDIGTVHPTFYAFDPASYLGQLKGVDDRLKTVSTGGWQKILQQTQFDMVSSREKRLRVIEKTLILGYWPTLNELAFQEYRNAWLAGKLGKQLFCEHFLFPQARVYEARIENKPFNPFKVSMSNHNECYWLLHECGRPGEDIEPEFNLPTRNMFDIDGNYIPPQRSSKTTQKIILPLAGLAVAGFVGYRML